MAIYLKYDGIDGSVTTKGFEKQIEISSAGFKSGRAMDVARRTDENRGHAEPFVSEIVLSKEWDDTSSGKLFEDSLSGVCDKKAKLSFTTTSKNTVVAYLEVELEKTVVSEYTLDGGSDGHPSERFNLNFTKVTITPYEVKDGKATKGAVVSYNLPNMEANG
jgi:type VI secretion system secreted protein Hcp